MTEADSTAATTNHELKIPAGHAVSTTRQRAKEPRIERDHTVQDHRESMLDEPTLTTSRIRLRQIDG